MHNNSSGSTAEIRPKEPMDHQPICTLGRHVFIEAREQCARARPPNRGSARGIVERMAPLFNLFIS